MPMAPSDELHDVAVPQLADDGHLGGVLFPPLTGAPRHSFYGNIQVQLVQETSVHRAEATFAELPVVREVASGSGKHVVAESFWSSSVPEFSLHVFVCRIGDGKPSLPHAAKDEAQQDGKG